MLGHPIMEPVLFYGVPHGCSFGSIVALEWLGEPYRLGRIDMLAAPQDPRYARINPLQETPTLVLEDGEVLTESLAILQHVAARGVEKGLGFAQGTPAFDRLNSVLAYLHTTLHSAFAPAWHAAKLPDAAPEREFLRTMAREEAASALGHVETMLTGREWLAGETRTVADAYLAGIARWANDLSLINVARDHPRLHRQLQKLEADPAVVFAHAIEDGRLATSSGRFIGHVTLDELSPRLAA